MGRVLTPQQEAARAIGYAMKAQAFQKRLWAWNRDGAEVLQAAADEIWASMQEHEGRPDFRSVKHGLSFF